MQVRIIEQSINEKKRSQVFLSLGKSVNFF
jgi:hypothetical protein